ncbi:MAG: ThuA domain-containing protein [Planctomycetota bacterium]|nr:ThuA domain-containing protein [Planctomycetota bacterium]
MNRCLACVGLCTVVVFFGNVKAVDVNPPAQPPPIKMLIVTGGGYHDYQQLVPYLTDELGKLVNCAWDVKWDINELRNPRSLDPYDVVVYDFCNDDAADEVLENAMDATRKGKATVMIHCAVHAFRKSLKIKEWEQCCGLQSKQHDPYGPFTVANLDKQHPITSSFPDHWQTPGDELYQMIAIDPKSHPLLRATSPQDGREHVVCWTSQYGDGKVFATTLGHDMKTTSSAEYLRLLAKGILWSCDRLQPDGQPTAGYAGPSLLRTP